jgi:hypothetical protein
LKPAGEWRRSYFRRRNSERDFQEVAGETEKVFLWLDEAHKQRALFLAWINVEPMFDSVRSDPRFVDLVKRIGLEPQPAGQDAVAI